MKTKLKLTGIGLRTPHFAQFLEQRPNVAWVEIHSENFFCEGGKPLHILEQVSQHYPISFHGVGLSIGSTDEINWQHLKKLRDLSKRIPPCLISDHLSWSSLDGQYFHDLLPLPYTEESLRHVIERVNQIQDYLGRQILIENISSYTAFEQSVLSESIFLAELSQATSCGILLDLNNIYVTASNLKMNLDNYLENIPAKAVQEIHLAGFSKTVVDDKEFLIDSHNQPVVEPVWDLYRKAIELYGPKATMIEWDADLPSLDILIAEAEKAELTLRDAYAATHAN